MQEKLEKTQQAIWQCFRKSVPETEDLPKEWPEAVKFFEEGSPTGGEIVQMINNLTEWHLSELAKLEDRL